jgi:hypothetical protein
MQKETRTYQELLAEVYEETAPNALVYAHEHLGDDADEYNVDKHEENELEDKEEFNKFQGARGNPEHVIKPKAKQDNDGKASFNYEKNIRTYAINVDGKFRAYPNIVPVIVNGCGSSVVDVIPPSNPTNFLFRASRLYKNIFSIKVTSFEFLNCFYTFTEARGNNKFILIDNNEAANNNPLGTKTIKIPDGNYFIQPGSPQVIDGLQLGATGATGPINPSNSNDLLLVLNTLIQKLPRQSTEPSYYGSTADPIFQDVYVEVDASDGFVIFYRKPKGTGPSNPFSIQFPKTDDNVYKNGIGYNLGFSQLSYSSGISTVSKHYATYHSIESESFPDTVNDTYVYLTMNDWYIIRHQNPDQTEIAAFMKIPLNVAKNSIQYMTNTSNTILNEYFFTQPTNFQTIEISLIDSFGKLIDMRGATFSVTLQIQEVLQSDIYEKMLQLQ